MSAADVMTELKVDAVIAGWQSQRTTSTHRSSR
jgi:hypothetical protein